MKVALIGGVTSTRVALERLVRHDLPPACVYGYEPEDSALVSGYVSLRGVCVERGVPYVPFRKINDHADQLRDGRYDVIFIIGLSQLVSPEIIGHARLGCVGFHPSLLPRGRGRAPVAWLVLEETAGAANLFLIDQGADSGPIFQQVPFSVRPEDDAGAVEHKALIALGEALDDWLPRLQRGEWNPLPQNELFATEYGKRNPEDGWIDWHKPAHAIDRLVKAAARPHPGAFTYRGDSKVLVWKCKPEHDLRIKGVVGRVLRVANQEGALVQTGNGLLRLTDYEVVDGTPLRVGMRLGYYCEQEIFRLRQEMAAIKERIGL